MHTKYFALFALLMLAWTPWGKSYAADTTAQLTLARTIPGAFSKMYIDNMQNIYVLSESSNQLKKFNSNGDSAGVFNDVKRYGNLYSVDVTNPLNIVAYYRDYATAVVLDRFFNKINVIDLRRAGILQCKAVSYSYDNNIWAFDQQECKLKKIDANGNVIFSSDDFRILFAQAPNPTSIIDNDGQLFLYDPDKGWFLFDYYGAFKTQLLYPGWSDVTVVNQKMIGRDSALFYIADAKTYSLLPIKTNIALAGKQQVFFSLDHAYMLTSSGVEIYTIKL